jgi:hypothetical protein
MNELRRKILVNEQELQAGTFRFVVPSAEAQRSVIRNRGSGPQGARTQCCPSKRTESGAPDVGFAVAGDPQFRITGCLVSVACRPSALVVRCDEQWGKDTRCICRKLATQRGRARCSRC